MNEERNNMTVTISGRCRNPDGVMDDLNIVIENVESVFMSCFDLRNLSGVQQRTAILGGFYDSMWNEVMKVMAEEVGVEPFLHAVMHVAGEMMKTAIAGGFEK